MTADVPLAKELVQEALGDERLTADDDGLARFLQERAQRLTPALADQLADLAKEAMMAQAWPVAMMAAGLGTSVNRRLGRLPEAVATQFLFAQVEYQQASSPHEYETARRALTEVVRRAEEIGDAHHAFEARGVMVQSGYFAAEAASDPHLAQACLLRALNDFEELLGSRPAPMGGEDALMAMEFAFAPLDLATSRLFVDPEAMEAALRRVAAAVDAHIPPDAALSSDPERDAAIARVVARFPSR